MVIAGFYAGILALIYVVLTCRVVGYRIANRVLFGDGGSEDMTRRIRAHGNFIEYVPLALILMGILDTQLASPGLLHVLGIALVASRVLHAIGVLYTVIPARIIGMVLTLAVIGVEAVLTITHYIL